MKNTNPNLNEIIERGKALYEAGIRAVVEANPANKGKRLALDTQTGEWEMDDDLIVATARLKARLPNAEPFALRVGYPYAFRIGAGAYSSNMPAVTNGNASLHD